MVGKIINKFLVQFKVKVTFTLCDKKSLFQAPHNLYVHYKALLHTIISYQLVLVQTNV